MTKIDPKKYNTPIKPTWCPGCGDYGIWSGLKAALSELGLDTHQIALTYGIGCMSNGANFINGYVLHSLHGRALPAAIGIKLANSKLTVISVAGDGGTYSEGANHLIHACRFNVDLTAIVADNRLFSLTTGQASPTSGKGLVTKTSHWGVVSEPLSPLAVAISAGATFVARAAAFDLPQLKAIFKEAINHPGFAIVNVVQQCVTFNKTNTVQWYKERVYNLDKVKHDPTNKTKALDRIFSDKENDKIGLGVFYRGKRPVYQSYFPQLKNKALIDTASQANVLKLMKEFA